MYPSLSKEIIKKILISPRNIENRKKIRRYVENCIEEISLAGKCKFDELSYLVLKAKETVVCQVLISLHTFIPIFPITFKCLKVIGTGMGCPLLTNDTVNISVLEKYGNQRECFYNYSMVQYVENFITGKQLSLNEGWIDTVIVF